MPLIFLNTKLLKLYLPATAFNFITHFHDATVINKKEHWKSGDCGSPYISVILHWFRQDIVASLFT